MASRSLKPEWGIVKNEEHEDTLPFDLDSTNANLKDPLGDGTDTDDVLTPPKDETKVKEEFGQSRSCSLGNVIHVKGHKVFIIEKPEPRRKGGRRPKYATPAERRKAKAAMARERRAKMTAEQREEYLQKRREASRERLAKLREEHEQHSKSGTGNDSQSMHKRTRYEESLEKRRESSRRRRKENPDRIRVKLKGYKTKYKKPETEEEREKKNMRHRLWYRKQMETKEGREMIRFRQYSRVQMKIAQMTDEELAEFKAKRSEAAKKWRENLTGEKLEKYRTYLRNNAKGKYHKRLAAWGEEYKAEINTRYRNYVANETLEQRQRRLRRYKINQAITKLRKQLEEIGIPPEEVERRVKELKKTMEAEPLPPPETLSKYKPRVTSDVNLSFPPRLSEGRRRGRPPGCSRQMDSKNEVTGNSNGQSGMGSTEMDDSNEFDHQQFIEDDLNGEVNADPNEETSTLEPVPILHFDIKCPHCSSSYSERGDLISHISSEHSEICWKCPKCKLIVLSSDELTDHYKKEHFQIRNGSTETTNSNSVSRGTTSSKKNNVFTCIKCDPVNSPGSETTFGSVKELMEHVKFNHFESFYPCSNCNILKYTKSSLKLHEKICKRTGKTVKSNR